MSQRGSTALLAILLAGATCLIGCGRGSARPITLEPTDVYSLARKSAQPANLSAPFNMVAWSQSGASRAPLAVSLQLAASAGGDWLAILPKPSDDLHWQPQFQQYALGSIYRSAVTSADVKRDDAISSCLTAIRKSGTKLAWDNRDGRMLLYFGSEEDLGHSRVHPPDTVCGVCLRAHNCAGMLATIADFWKLKIDADPALLARRDALLGGRLAAEEPDEPRGTMGAISRMYRAGMMGGRMMKAPGNALTLLVDEKITPERLLSRVAEMMGGECVHRGDVWRIAALLDPARAKSEIGRLKQIVAEKAGTEYVHASPNPMTGEPVVVVGTLSDEAQQAIESLAALGPAALPALREYLTAERASVAQATLRALLALDSPEASTAVIAFGTKLLGDTSTAGKAQAARPLLLADIVRALSSRPTDVGSRWLAKAATDARVSAELRLKARMALAGSGRLALLIAAPRASALHRFTEFALTVGPDGKPAEAEKTGAVTPLATCKASDGSTWAVFTSGRCGDALDFWLSHGKGQHWTEFLFTGKSFPRENMQYIPWGSKPPGPGSLSLKLAGDTITLGPPAGPSDEQELARLRDEMRKPGLSSARRRRVMQQYATRQSMQWQRRMSQLQQTIALSLRDMRKDTDHDGLTDLIEKRLGTDPMNPDTDRDGLADGEDPNPLVPHVANLTDTQRLIQAIFTTLFAGDPNTDPIVVVLDRKDWMEFPGSGAPVYCVTREEYLRRANSFNAFRVLQFGGPGRNGATILNVDGPVSYNDSRTRAEIHFWQLSARTTLANPWMAIYTAQFGSTGAPIDYMALFSRKGSGWRLETLKPWQADTADTAMGELMRRQMDNGGLQ